MMERNRIVVTSTDILLGCRFAKIKMVHKSPLVGHWFRWCGLNLAGEQNLSSNPKGSLAGLSDDSCDVQSLHTYTCCMIKIMLRHS